MKAAVLHAPAPVETNPLKIERDWPEPDLSGSYRVLIRVEAAGVCHTDLHIVEGRVFKPGKLPLIPGHEVVGRVVEVGHGVDWLQRGDRVGVWWVWQSCGQCEYCLTGREQLCPNRVATGLNVDGGYAEYMVADARYVVRIPEGVRPEDAAPAMCAGITAYSSVRKSGARPGARIAVIGVGGLGSFAIQLAKLSGAHVTAVTRGHQRLAAEMGADEVISPEELDEYVKRRGGFDAALNFAPSPSSLAAALRAVKRGGVVVNAANMETLPEVDYRAHMAGEKTLMSVSVGNRASLRELLSLMAQGRVRPIPTQVMPLDEANEALRRLKRGEVHGRIVLKP